MSMEYIAKQKARLVVLNTKAQRIGFSVHASVGNELHYGWWYIVTDGSGPTGMRVAAICNNLDDVDMFLTKKKREAVKGQRSPVQHSHMSEVCLLEAKELPRSPK